MKKITLIFTEQEALACIRSARMKGIAEGDDLMIYHVGKKIKEAIDAAGSKGDYKTVLLETIDNQEEKK
jgi:hypothetical protein